LIDIRRSLLTSFNLFFYFTARWR